MPQTSTRESTPSPFLLVHPRSKHSASSTSALTMVSLCMMLLGSTSILAFSNDLFSIRTIRQDSRRSLPARMSPFATCRLGRGPFHRHIRRNERILHDSRSTNALVCLQMSDKNSQNVSTSSSSSSGNFGPIPSELLTNQLPLPDVSIPFHHSSSSGETMTSSVVPPGVVATTNTILQQSEMESALIFVQEEVNLEDAYEKAILQTIVWVGLASLFGLGLIQFAGLKTGEEFFAGYIVEQSLSVDNLFVFLILFDYFKVPMSYQGRVLNWGILGAIVMRGIMIGLGAAALKQFHSILLLFATFLVYSSIQTLSGLVKGEQEDDGDVGDDVVVKFTRRLLPSVDYFDGDRFFTLVDGIKKATPLLLCMVAVEISDVVFAVDSIPAVFGVTENPLVVFSSNMFAIMGLRSLYIVLSKAAQDLEFLEPAVAVVLGFIGGKMIAEYFGVEISTTFSLAMVSGVLGTGVGLSLLKKNKTSETIDE